MTATRKTSGILSAMQRLSALLTARNIDHTCDPSGWDTSVDDGINMTNKTPQGYALSVQCATNYSPREQQDYELSVFDEAAGIFYHIPDSNTSDVFVILDVVSDFLQGTRSIQSDMELLSAALTGAEIVHSNQQSSDDGTDDNITLQQKTGSGDALHIQCTTAKSPSTQETYIVSLEDKTGHFHHHVPCHTVSDALNTIRQLLSK